MLAATFAPAPSSTTTPTISLSAKLRIGDLTTVDPKLLAKLLINVLTKLLTKLLTNILTRVGKTVKASPRVHLQKSALRPRPAFGAYDRGRLERDREEER